MEYVLVNNGLGKPFWKKIRLRAVSLKNVVKVTKKALPIVASMVPVLGNVGSGILSKVLTNSDGTSSLIGRIADNATALAKTTVGKTIISTVKSNVRPQIQTVNSLTPAPVVANPVFNTQSDQPVGDLTPVTPAMISASVAKASEALQSTTKDNTALYAIGAVAVLGGIYLATKKS